MVKSGGNSRSRKRTQDAQRGGGGSIGPSTDATNTPVIDPTENVLQLVDASERRQDDLREMTTEYQRQLQVQHFEHLKELMELRSDFYADLRSAESARIDAIRAVDVQAVQRSAEVQADQATALATQVSVSAETLRTQVAAAAAAAATSLGAALVPIQEAIADLRRVQYEQQGSKASQTETKTDTSRVMAFVFGGIGAFIGVAGLVFAVLVSVKP